jgi:DNA polymerase-3 subunit alpha
VDLGYKGIAVTDHECLSSHVEALKTVKSMKKDKIMPQDFKLILGNEIYLVNSLIDVRDNYQKGGITKFPHFILLACDEIGYEQLKELSSIAWENRFVTGLMERVPTEKHILKEVIGSNKGHLIATTACLGSELAINTLKLIDAENEGDNEKISKLKIEIDVFMKWCIDVFGKDKFFVELQPALSAEQIAFNKRAVSIASFYNIKTIVATDAHFLRPEDLLVHKAYLNSKDGDRETESFYEACFVQKTEEIVERLSINDNLTEVQINEAIANTMLIGEMVEDYDLKQDVSIPKIELPEFTVRHLFKPAYKKFEYIEKMSNSKEDQDRFLVKLIEDGFDEKVPRNTLSKEYFYKILSRINIELEELWHISLSMNQAMSAYYVTIREIINIIWDDCGGNSIVGAGRGSAAGFYINYLLDITQVDPMKYDLPHWRHLHKSRPDFPDIDIDSEASKRQTILKALKDRFGERKVLNIATFGTEKSKSAVLTSCRGLGIDSDTAAHIASLIPWERGQNWSLSDCLYGDENENRKPVVEFINEIEKHDRLKETALKIEGLVNKRSIHASGVFVYNEDFTKKNAMMRAPSGQWTTQFSMSDSEYMGGIKYDFLTVEGMDKMRETLNLLVEYNEIEWQGSLKQTYKKYIHPDTLDYKSPEVWNRIGNNEVIDLFQFNTQIGIETIRKTKPTNVLEMSVANSLMRLMAESGAIQPVDLYVKHKENIEFWYEEMREANLTVDEITIMEKHLLAKYGVADSQESIMIIVMDVKIGNCSVADANVLRKAIAKKDKDYLETAKDLFYSSGEKAGTSIHLLNYVWNVQVKRQIGYSFSDLHNIVYTIIGIQEVNLFNKYNPLYWNTAVLTVNSSSSDEQEDIDEEDRKNKSTDYGKVASAIGMLKSHNVNIGLPDINKAAFGFKPDTEANEIVYGLKGVVGIGDDIVQHIVSKRPYSSFEDFLIRLYDTSTVKKSHVIQLIKAGCFDSFDDRFAVMRKFINKIFSPKEKLNMQNFNMLVENNLIPDELKSYASLYKFRKYVIKKIHSTTDKKDKQYLLDSKSQPYFDEHFSDGSVVDYLRGYALISEKLFKKEYDKKMDGIKDWLTNPQTLELVNRHLFNEEWNSNASGSTSKWEMDSLSFYYGEHELLNIKNEMLGISSFSNLPEEVEIVDYFQFRDGGTRPKFKISAIVGTVLDRDKNKHTVTLLTPDGVVTVKYYDGAFAQYNKQVSKPITQDKKEILEKSWFTRGNKLVIFGYRRGSQFVPKVYKDTKINDKKIEHTTMLITDVLIDGSFKTKSERTKI